MLTLRMRRKMTTMTQAVEMETDLQERADLRPRVPLDPNQAQECLHPELGAQPRAASPPLPQQPENLKETRMLAVKQ